MMFSNVLWNVIKVFYVGEQLNKISIPLFHFKLLKILIVYLHICMRYSQFVTKKSMKQIENATRGNVYAIHKYIEHVPSKSTTISIREKGTDKYEKTHTQAVAIELSRRRRQLMIFYSEYILYTEDVRISKGKIKWTTVTKNSINLVWSCVFEHLSWVQNKVQVWLAKRL